MRRRRFPRRMIRRRSGMRFAGQRPPIPAKLIEAHGLFEAGEYGKAAELYRELAENARQRGIPQAPRLYFRAAVASLKAGKHESALELAKNGFRILIDHKQWHQLKRLSNLTLARLESEGHAGLASQIRGWLDDQIPEDITRSDAWRKAAVGVVGGSQKLASTCGQCGGPVHPQEVEWHDPYHPVCAYCGAGLDTSN